MAERKTFRARCILPIDGPPLTDAVVEVEGERIVALHHAVNRRTVELGNVALLPGLVNAHAHLEFSDLKCPISPATPFTDWLRAVIRSRERSTVSREESLRRGIEEVISQGTAIVGDIATANWSATSVADCRVEIVAFHEWIALAKERMPRQIENWQRHRESCRAFPSIHQAISPHAPYSIHPDLFSTAVKVAREEQIPLAIHLAETKAEIEFLKSASGEFRDFLIELGVWRDDAAVPDRSPIDFLQEMSELPHGLIVHGNYLAANEIEFLEDHPQLTVVYCPRTHAYFGHDPHPWKELLSRGVSLALGTDGRSSNPDLSLWNELLFLHRQHPDVPVVTLLRLGTINGARALGLEHDFGSLTPGKRAAMAIVELPASGGSITEELLFTPACRMLGLLDLEQY